MLRSTYLYDALRFIILLVLILVRLRVCVCFVQVYEHGVKCHVPLPPVSTDPRAEGHGAEKAQVSLIVIYNE